jgi:methionyl-tRNA formyltransferase
LSTSATSLRLGFAGTPDFAVPALNALAASKHEVCAVFTQPDRPAGRGQALRTSAVKRRAGELGLLVHQPINFKAPDALALLRGLRLDALVVVAYGLILPASALVIPRLGCFNIHASLLPRWRGAAPIQRAILAGDPVSGITIMRMDAGLDTGPVLSTRAVDIEAHDTAKTLGDRLAVLGGELICAAMDALAVGSVRETPQPQSGATHAAKIEKSEARIDWSEDARVILRKVHAFNPWPIAETRLAGAQLRIWDAELAADANPGSVPVAMAAPGTVPPGTVTVPPGTVTVPAGTVTVPPGTVLAAGAPGVDVACGSGVLSITRLQLPGRKPLSAREFLNAQPLEGARFGTE